jgi:hypothetical protein
MSAQNAVIPHPDGVSSYSLRNAVRVVVSSGLGDAAGRVGVGRRRLLGAGRRWRGGRAERLGEPLAPECGVWHPLRFGCESAASGSGERTDLVHQNLYTAPLDEGSDAVRHVEGIRTRRVI